MKKILLFSILFVMICFLFVFKILTSLEEHTQRSFETCLKKATEEEASSKQLKETDQAQKFEYLLKGLNSLNIALYLKPADPQARQKKAEITQALISLALEFENYQ
ncbi:MAG: hypothetical protein AABZ60_23535, partial [Planctomycetota bacterium]